ncbi:MAG: SulP family inorganic anion transporter [Betaproteobacteria bacterium]|nr:SulP family inorganic anion transporter [Betaproteobacteria bacterium]
MQMQLKRFLPFLNWFPLRSETIKSDLVAGITVALVLIPQSMAYAQLAGLPAYYGLYAAFMPGIIAALWGSSAQLATGPVAVVSLLTASALAPLAASGSSQFIALAVLMALMVGLIQLTLGVFKLGVVVNFLSHPVIVGFTNAAAIIIGLSQLNKLFGVSMGRSEHFIQDIWGVIQQIGDTHIPTLLMGISAFAIMWGLKKFVPKMPGVLIAVALTTIVSWSIGFEHNSKGKIESIMDVEVKTLANDFSLTEIKIDELNGKLNAKSTELKRHQKSHEEKSSQRTAALNYEIELLKLELKDAEGENRKLARSMRKFIFEQVSTANGQPGQLYLAGQVPQNEKSDGYRWRIKKVSKGELKLVGGGEVVGSIPAGLPQFDLPKFSWDMMATLFSGALVISLVGFMEAISIAKAMAAKTKDRIDPNQELIGQGIANIVGSFSQAFPASGSFSRSAVNLNAGARTGMSSVFAGIIVLVTLLFLTPLLYHLPQAVLAAVIMMAVIGLINFKAIKHAWHAHKHDGIASAVTFVATLAFAPHLDNGIMVGAGLAILLYLYRTMKPRVAILGRYSDGTLRDAKVHNLPTSEHIIAMRYDGSLYFANVPYFEDTILEAVANNPKASYLLVVGDGINQLDASGEEVIHHMVQRLKDNGVTMVFSGLKKQVLDVMRHTGLFDLITQDNIFPNEDMAVDAIYEKIRAASLDAKFCLLQPKNGEANSAKIST